ncbi:MAG: hypothetical protein NC398_06435 [Acetatifactor muris]|nr:hypothetical protein [Acetatifactor muris]MCM1526614.1 hypothetical protein [Bacteroides sp.]
MEERKPKRKRIKLEIDDVVFVGIAKTNVYLKYYPDNGTVSIMKVITNGKWKGSNKNWLDMASYGQQELELEDIVTLSEIADAIRDAEWRYFKEGPAGEVFADEDVRQAILSRLYNAKTEFPQFVAEQLQSGKYADITDSEGWTELWKFSKRFCEEYHIPLTRALLLDLPNVDSRFELKDTEPRTVMLADNRPIQLSAEKPLIRMR